MKNKNAIIYSRVSTHMQEEKDSLVVQIQKCEEYCNYHNYKVLDVITDVESGAKDDREGFQKVLSLVKNKTFDVLVVYETSRISRKTKTLVNLIHDLTEHGVSFVSISQRDINTETAAGMMMFELMASLAAYERRLISDREKSSKKIRAKNGQWLGGTKPLGYDVIEKKLIINEVEASIVRGMFQMFLDEKSLSKVAKHYNRHIESVKWILTNPLYIGKRKWGQKEKNIITGKTKINKTFDIFDSHQEAIVREDLFESVNFLIENNRKKKILSTSKLIFPGMIVCPKCGSKKLYALTMKSKYHYYKCDNKADKCNFLLKKDEVDDKLLEQVIDNPYLDKLNGLREDFLPLAEHERALLERIENSKNEIKKLARTFIKGLISEETFEELKKEIDFSMEAMKKEVKDLERKISNAKSKNIDFNHHKKFIEALKNMTEEDIPQMKKILRLMIDKIEITDIQKKEFKVHYNF